MRTISNVVRSGVELEILDLQSALESCVELLKHINSDSRKILNKFLLEAYKFGLETDVFSSDEEMHCELLQFKSNFYILHPKNIDRFALLIQKLDQFNNIHNIDLALLANKNKLLSEYPEYPEFKSLIADLEHDYPVFDADFQFNSD